MKHKIANWFIIASLIVSFAILLLFLFWWIYPYKTIEVSKQPYPVLTPTVQQGEMMMYQIDYCKYTEAIATVSKSFVDGIVYAIPENSLNLPKGCDSRTTSIIVPKSLPPGNYYLRILGSYKINPIRVITVEYVTEHFDVVK